MRLLHIIGVATALLSCRTAPANSQQLTVHVGAPTVVATGTEQEPYLAVDPSNPAHLVAAAIVSSHDTGSYTMRMPHQTCAAFVSFDGGVTWSRHVFSTTWCFDPWVALTEDGAAVVSMGGDHASLPQQGHGGLLVFRSPDGGRTWNDQPVGLGGAHDHPTIALDRHSATKHGWLYVVSHRPTRDADGAQRYGVWLARSRDGGKRFDDPTYVIVNNLHNLVEMPAVLRDGTVVVSFVDAAYQADSGAQGRSLTFFDRRRAWVVRSTDGATTFSAPLFVTDACGPPPAYRLSAFAVDASSGAFTDRLYFACRQAGGGPIVVTRSRDRGETWSPPVAMQGSPTDSSAARIPALAVNDRGVVGVAWIDATERTGCEQSVYFAASSDGGATFTPSAEISRMAACGTGGDYFGLVAMPDGSFRLLWSAEQKGVSKLLMVRIELGARGEPRGD